VLVFVAIIALQIACVVHCIRRGRSGLWIMAIVFFPVLGSLAYIILEVLPAYSGRREVRAIKQAAAKAIDPERDLRRAREALDIADTAANRTDVADALAALGRWSEAIAHYEQAEAKAPGIDRGLRLKLATACFEAERSDRALALIESLPPSGSASENDRASLLHARLLEEAGQAGRAIAIYADIGERMAGGEALCRQAALLLAEGRGVEALALLAEVEKRAKRMDRYERARNADMYEWAADQLAELRSEGVQSGA
jgi:hypothetical protein